MKNTVYLNSATLFCADSLELIKTLPDNSVDLIATDPPYFKVKKEKWDNQWDDQSEFLGWIDEFLGEFWRILKPTGSMYIFCSHNLSADIEILVRHRFEVFNHIVWAKPYGRWNASNKESLRKYFPSTERIIFAGHYGSVGLSKGQVGYATKCKQLKQQVFEPLISYFKNARDSLGITAAEINKATGTQMSSHWFSSSQWQLPKEEQYLALQKLFEDKAEVLRENHKLAVSHRVLTDTYSYLHAEYKSLSVKYDDLRKEYQNLRRPFNVTKHVPHTDVWTYSPVQYYKGKHPCEKPAEMMEHIILSSSRPGDVVADFFMGSGSTIKAAIKHGRKAIGVELEEERFNQTVEEIKQVT